MTEYLMLIVFLFTGLGVLVYVVALAVHTEDDMIGFLVLIPSMSLLAVVFVIVKTPGAENASGSEFAFCPASALAFIAGFGVSVLADFIRGRLR